MDGIHILWNVLLYYLDNLIWYVQCAIDCKAIYMLGNKTNLNVYFVNLHSNLDLDLQFGKFRIGKLNNSTFQVDDLKRQKTGLINRISTGSRSSGLIWKSIRWLYKYTACRYSRTIHNAWMRMRMTILFAFSYRWNIKFYHVFHFSLLFHENWTRSFTK